MPCPLTDNSLPQHLKAILKKIEVSNNQTWKDCACRLLRAEQRSDSDFGYYVTALPWCFPTLEDIQEALAEANGDTSFTHTMVDEHEVDLKDISEAFYAKKIEFKGSIIRTDSACSGDPVFSVHISSSFNDLVDGIDIEKSVCDARFDNPENSEFYPRSFVYGQTPPLWQALSAYYTPSSFMGFNSALYKYCEICPTCQELVQEGVLDEDDCDPANCLAYHSIFMKIFPNIYKYEEGSDCEKGRFKYKQFGVKIVNNDAPTTNDPYIATVRNTLKGYGFHLIGDGARLNGPNRPPIIQLTIE